MFLGATLLAAFRRVERWCRRVGGVASASACTESRTRSDTRMVVVVRMRLCGGHGAARSNGEFPQGCQLRGPRVFARGRARMGEERLPQGLAGWQLFCSLQRGF